MKILPLLVILSICGSLFGQEKASSKVRNPFGTGERQLSDSTKHLRKEVAERSWTRVPDFAFTIEEECVIVLQLVVNEQGDILVATNVASKSTTTDSTLISQVIAAVKRKGKFNAVPGAKNISIQRTFKLIPQ